LPGWVPTTTKHVYQPNISSLHHKTKALKFAAPDLFAAGNYANQVPGKKPDWPSGNTIRQSIAIGTVGDSTVHFEVRGSTFLPFHKDAGGKYLKGIKSHCRTCAGIFEQSVGARN
jgi:hypothetical protein